MDSAAASGTTPRVPAQDTTAGTGQDGRRTPLRRWTTAKTQTMRVTISVPATASASAGHASPWDAVLQAVRLIVWWIPSGTIPSRRSLVVDTVAGRGMAHGRTRYAGPPRRHHNTLL